MSFDSIVGIANYFGYVSCALSFFGSIFIIYTMWRMKPSFSLLWFIFYLSVGDMLLSIGRTADLVVAMNYPSYATDEVSDLIISSWIYYWNASTFVWSTFIAFYHHIHPTEESMWKFHLIAWLLPLLTVLQAFVDIFTDLPQSMLDFCCLVIACDSPFLDIMDYKCFNRMFLMLIGCVCWATIAVLYATILIRRRHSEKEKKYLIIESSRESQRLLDEEKMDTTEPVGRDERVTQDRTTADKTALYILVFGICYIPLLVKFIPNSNRILFAIFYYLDMIFTTGQGFLNALIYGTSYETATFVKLSMTHAAASVRNIAQLQPPKKKKKRSGINKVKTSINTTYSSSSQATTSTVSSGLTNDNYFM